MEEATTIINNMHLIVLSIVSIASALTSGYFAVKKHLQAVRSGEAELDALKIADEVKDKALIITKEVETARTALKVVCSAIQNDTPSKTAEKLKYKVIEPRATEAGVETYLNAVVQEIKAETKE